MILKSSVENFYVRSVIEIKIIFFFTPGKRIGWKMENKRIVSSNSISIRKVSFEDPITIEHDFILRLPLKFPKTDLTEGK